MLKHKISLLLILCFIGISISAQQSRVVFNFSYGLDMPLGDLKERYGFNYSPTFELDYEFENDWFIGVNGSFMLGSIVKEDVIKPLREESGWLVSQQKTFARITLKQRMNNIGIHVGKFINVSNKKNQHGPLFNIGLGLLTHYIIFNDESASTVQLLGKYGKGYDRLTRGYNISQFIGYKFKNRDGRLNVFAGLQFLEANTKSLRPIDFDTGEYGGKGRLDILIGFRVGATFILWKGAEKGEIFY